MLTNKIFQTKKEIEREQRCAGVISRYKHLKKDNPYVTKRRVMLLVAEEYGYTSAGVRAILVRNNVEL